MDGIFFLHLAIIGLDNQGTSEKRCDKPLLWLITSLNFNRFYRYFVPALGFCPSGQKSDG